MTGSSWEKFEQRKQALEANSSMSYFERYSSPHTHPGGGVFRTLVQKLRVLANFIVRRIAQGPGRHQALSPLAGLAGSAAGRDVLVIASGPSAASLNVREVAKRQRAGDLVVVVTNYFLNSPLATTITPDYLVWSDSVFSPMNRGHNAKAWDALEATPDVRVVVPWTWHSVITTMTLADRFLYFDNDTLEGWSSNISPLKPRGYQGSTGVKALALALHLGGRQVFVAGLDLSYFQQFTVDSDNRVLRQPAHLKNTDSGIQDIGKDTINGLADTLYSTANQFLALRSHFSGRGVINLDPQSLVDAFAKVTEHPLVKKPRSTPAATR